MNDIARATRDSLEGSYISLRVAPPGSFDDGLIALRDALYRRALALTRVPADAEDLVQDTLARAMQARDQFRDGTNIGAWAVTIMRNLFIDEQRRRVKEFSLHHSSPPDRGEHPLDLLSHDDVAVALSALSGAQREAFTLAYVQRLSYREIARCLGVSINTTGTRVLRAKRRVRAMLADILDQRLHAHSTDECTEGPR